MEEVKEMTFKEGSLESMSFPSAIQGSVFQG